MGPFGSHFEPIESHLGPLESCLGVIWDQKRVIWDCLGQFGNHLGDTWCHLEVILVDSDSQSKFLSESVSQLVSEIARSRLLLCETELELKT